MEDLDMKEKRRVQNRESQRRLRARKRNVRAENTRDETESQSKVNNLAGNDFDMEAPLLHGARARKEVFQKGAYPSDPLSFPSWMSSTAELISSPASGVQNPLTSLMPPAPISASSAAQKFHISKPEERLADCDEIQWTQMVATSPPAVDLSSLIPPQDSRLCNTSVHHQSEDLLAPLSFEGNTRVNYQVSNSRSRVLKDTQAEETEKPVKDFKVPYNGHSSKRYISNSDQKSPRSQEQKLLGPRVTALLSEIRILYDFSISMGLLEEDCTMRAKLQSLHQQFKSLVRSRERRTPEKRLGLESEDTDYSDYSDSGFITERTNDDI